MRHALSIIALAVTALLSLSACDDGDDDHYPDGPPPSLQSFVGTTGVILAYADPLSGNFWYAPIGSYAGKRQVHRGSIDFLSGIDLGQPAGLDIYKAYDGHIYALDLTAFGIPAAQQLSSESSATVDDTCSLSGTAVTGANTDYVGVYFVADLQNTLNSSYFYRLPGADGVCDTADDVVHLVKTGMAPTDAPLAVAAVPVTTVRTAAGGISGFVLKSGASLVLVDGNGANPTVLGTFAAPIGVATVLPVGTVQGYPTGQLFLVDGNVVYVDYTAKTTSAALFSIPDWSPTNPGATFAASPTTLYFAVNSVAPLPATAALYALPADGSAAPTLVDSEAGRIVGMQFPVQSGALVFSVESPAYSLRALPTAGGPAVTLTTSSGNGGSFTATAAEVYYTMWTASFDSSTNTVTHNNTQSGIVALDSTVIQAPLANSMFATGGEQLPWPADSTTTQTAYETVFLVTGLTPVTVTNATTGTQYVEDGVSGGSVEAIDTASNQVVAAIGTLPISTATFLSGTFRGYDDTGFLETSNVLSTEDPATRDAYLLNARGAMSLLRVTNNL